MSQVQFNLLPTSRSQASQSRHGQTHLVKQITTTSFALAAIFILSLAYSEGVQRSQLSSAKKSVTTKSAQLQKVANLNTILTVENQLTTAASLHQNQHDSSRIFTYLANLTPSNASINSVELDLTANTIKIDGTADSANTVNAFIDTLKFVQYKVGSSSNAKAFSSVVESSFSINQNNVSYSLNASFDPNLFSNALTDGNGKLLAPQLIIPSSSTSRSNDPASLFGGSR